MAGALDGPDDFTGAGLDRELDPVFVLPRHHELEVVGVGSGYLDAGLPIPGQVEADRLRHAHQQQQPQIKVQHIIIGPRRPYLSQFISQPFRIQQKMYTPKSTPLKPSSLDSYFSSLLLQKRNQKGLVVTENQYANLLNYRNHLVQEMKCLEAQSDRDEAELRLMLLKAKQANSAMVDEARQAQSDLLRLKTELATKARERYGLEENNFRLIEQFKKALAEQRQGGQGKSQLDQEKTNLMNSILVNDPSQLKARNNAVKMEIQQITKQVEEKNQVLQSFKNTELYCQEKISLLQAAAKHLKQGLRQKQQEFVNLSKSVKSCKQQLEYLKKKQTHIKNSIQRIQQQKMLTFADLEAQEGQRQYLSCYEEELTDQLQLVMRDLQTEQAGQTREQELIEAQKQRHQENKSRLSQLHDHLLELKAANQKYREVLRGFEITNSSIARTVAQTLPVKRRSGRQAASQLEYESIERQCLIIPDKVKGFSDPSTKSTLAQTRIISKQVPSQSTSQLKETAMSTGFNQQSKPRLQRSASSHYIMPLEISSIVNKYKAKEGLSSEYVFTSRDRTLKLAETSEDLYCDLG